MLQHHKPLAVNLYTANAGAVRIVAIYAHQSICKYNARLHLPRWTPQKILTNFPSATPPPVAGIEVSNVFII